MCVKRLAKWLVKGSNWPNTDATIVATAFRNQ